MTLPADIERQLDATEAKRRERSEWFLAHPREAFEAQNRAAEAARQKELTPAQAARAKRIAAADAEIATLNATYQAAEGRHQRLMRAQMQGIDAEDGKDFVAAALGYFHVRTNGTTVTDRAIEEAKAAAEEARGAEERARVRRNQL